jgi:hypothetical protein
MEEAFMGSNMDSKEFDLYKDIRCRTNGEIYIGAHRQVHIYKAFHGALCHPEDGQ